MDLKTKQRLYSGRMNDALDSVIATVGKNLRVATPLGLGKPNRLLNALYDRAVKDPTLNVSIFTALSLALPSANDLLARRFLAPFSLRHWGGDYPDLKYSLAARRGLLPANVRVHEFYVAAGSALASESLQRDYQSLNYTHVVSRLIEEGANVVFQLIAADRRGGEEKYSLSCNSDLTLDLVERARAAGKPCFVVGVIHPDLPFLKGEAEVSSSFFDRILEDENPPHTLFAIPHPLVDKTEHAIGFYASQLVVDDGTIQIGIGSLSDALVAALVMREKQNQLYLQVMEDSWRDVPIPSSLKLSGSRFSEGLYGLSEMVMDGFMHLRKAGILRRTVKDVISGVPTYLHGAFMLGSKSFYDWLRCLEGDDLEGLRMGRISNVNHLYNPHLEIFREQRKNPRFFNTCMQVTLLGGAASETLENGRVVSGVGGQYNFVAMSHELKNSRSILMLRSTRLCKGKRSSNIVWAHGHLTIPRHLRDIVVTEYGIADIRGKTDKEVICSLLNVTDSEFQPELLAMAKQNGKVACDYRIPEWASHNTPERPLHWMERGVKRGEFGRFPWGSDFTPEEENLVEALDYLKALSHHPHSRYELARCLMKSFTVSSQAHAAELQRMQLASPKGRSGRFYRRLLLGALEALSPVDKGKLGG